MLSIIIWSWCFAGFWSHFWLMHVVVAWGEQGIPIYEYTCLLMHVQHQLESHVGLLQKNNQRRKIIAQTTSYHFVRMKGKVHGFWIFVGKERRFQSMFWLVVYLPRFYFKIFNKIWCWYSRRDMPVKILLNEGELLVAKVMQLGSNLFKLRR